MNHPELLASPAAENPYCLVAPIESDIVGAYPASRIRDGLDPQSLFPIAKDTTLLPDFYNDITLDTSYSRDRNRIMAVERLQILAGHENDEQAGAMIRRVARYFEVSLLESDYLKYAFSGENELFSNMSRNDMNQFLKPFDVANQAEADAFNGRICKVPEDIRALAFEDIAVAHEVLALFTGYDLDAISTSQPVANYLVTNGFSELAGDDRVRFLHTRNITIRNIVSQQHILDQLVKGGTDVVAAQSIVDTIISRKRQASDGVDGNVFGYYTNCGAITDPSYLFGDSYATLLEEPVVDKSVVWQTMLHMITGNYTFGHDHTYLYRNRNAAIASSYAGTPPDYSVVRPGNYLFHDLKYVENSGMRDDFCEDYLLEYLIAHYIDGMDVYAPESVTDGLPDDSDTAAYIYSNSAEGRYATPLEKVTEHVVPFRALKKDLVSEAYFEYGEECYLAELVDIALQCDVIALKARPLENRVGMNIDGTMISHYANRLLEQIQLRSPQSQAAAIVLDQLLFMQGKQVDGGRDAIRQCLQDGGLAGLARLAVIERRDQNGDPEIPKPALTCYYEWFQRFARPLSPAELHQRGIPMKPALF